jgi:hypothetical protein
MANAVRSAIGGLILRRTLTLSEELPFFPDESPPQLTSLALKYFEELVGKFKMVAG